MDTDLDFQIGKGGIKLRCSECRGMARIAVCVPYSVILETSGTSFRSPPGHFLGVRTLSFYAVSLPSTSSKPRSVFIQKAREIAPMLYLR